ncbi:MAG: ROK family transcriptional regulator [Planctomycetaceae bacterium]|nr:ROK family transcriptional regulator [Planctomycetaceae bacterium]
MRFSQMAERPHSLRTLMQSNRLNVLSAVRAHPHVTIADLAFSTGLSKVTVTKCLEHYLQEGLIKDRGKDEAEDRGKPPTRYSFNPGHKVVFCVKIDDVHLFAALTDLEGGIIASHSAYYNAVTPLDHILACIRDAFTMLLERTGRSASECVAAVVGCHGVIDPELGICFVSPHFSDWGLDIPIRDMVARLLPPNMPVYVNNWIHYHAYGELRAMHSTVSRFFLIGTEMEGVAGGLVIDGRIYRGSGSLSGEIAHMVIDTRPQAELCECGGKGCFEASISPKRMVARAKAFTGSDEEITFPTILQAANDGEGWARQLVDEAISHWAIGITNIVQISDPELIIIQGEYANAGPYFLSNLLEKIQTVSLVRMRKTVEIAYSTVGDQGTILGAGAFAAEKYLAQQG